MNAVRDLERLIRERTGRRFVRLVGRGTTAEYVALRAVTLAGGSQSVVIPDVICVAVLDGALLAGYAPHFADVLPGRFTLDPGALPTLSARAVTLVTHLFGFRVSPVPAAASGPCIEDAVQGIGGEGVGTLGAISFISFDETKMIAGRGGAVLTDDPALWEAIQAIALDGPLPPPAEPLGARLRAYRAQLERERASRIVPFNGSAANIERILTSWGTLPARARARNEKAARLHAAIRGLPLLCAAPAAGDAIWRYPIAAPNPLIANWILRHMQAAGLRGSSLYVPLSTIYAEQAPLTPPTLPTLPNFARGLAGRMVNLWVDESTSETALDQAIAILRAAPYARLGAVRAPERGRSG